MGGLSVFLPVRIVSQFGELSWNLMPWGSVKKGVTGEEEGFEDSATEEFSEEFCLAMRDAVRELSSFCSRVLSVKRRLHLRDFEKTKLSLDLSESLEWKCKIAVKSTGFLYRHVLCTGLWRLCGHMWIFMSRKDISWLE